MKVEKIRSEKGLLIDGPLLIKPEIFSDERGQFMESWNQKTFDKLIDQKTIFVQDNQSISIKNVIRGLHYQASPNSQDKLVRCCKGEIFDVAIDLRLESETFGLWVSVKLSDKNKFQLWIPKGFAHGFMAISNEANVLYKTTSYFSRKDERSILWNDPTLNIKWPTSSSKPLLSRKDKNAPLLSKISKNDFL